MPNLNTTALVNVTVAREVTNISTKNCRKCSIPVYLDNVDRKNERSINLTAYGAIADACMKVLKGGRRIDCICKPRAKEDHVEFAVTDIVFG